MSRRRRRREAPMPAASAGLLRFFEEETQGIRFRPEIIIGFTVAFIILSIILRLQYMGRLHLPLPFP